MTQEETSKTDKLIEKIKKILLKAGSTDSQEEAEALFVKASEMMIKFKIEQSQIDSAIDENSLTEDEITCGEFSLEGKWELELASALTKYNGTYFLFDSRKKYKVTLGGDKHDIQMVKYFFETARATFRRLSREQYLVRKKMVMAANPSFSLKELEYYKYMPYRSVFIRSFLLGCSMGLGEKLREMQRQTVSQHDTTQSYGLMLRNQLEKSKGFMLDKHKPKNVTTPKAFGDQQAIRTGFEVGKNHNLTIGVTGSSKNEGNKIG